MTRMVLRVSFVALAFGRSTLADTPFAVEVIEYRPAPGQFVNDPNFDDPGFALGPPTGGGTDSPDHSSVVSLGGFGGSITLRFDHVVEDHPLNPFGLDAIVFGNAFWVGGSPNHRWGEPATIEIALDTDGDGAIGVDESWYLIPGSHIDDPGDSFFVQTWDDDVEDPMFPPAEVTWIPASFSGVWTTFGFLLPPTLFGAPVVVNPSPGTDEEFIYGYGDMSPTLILGDFDGDNVVDDPAALAETFYVRPDNPRSVGLSPNSCGGDAFDINWAVDRSSGQPAGIRGFDFIRLTSGTMGLLEDFGEKSAEIDAVSDVAPDPFADIDQDFDLDLYDAGLVLRCFDRSPNEDGPCETWFQTTPSKVDLIAVAAFVDRMTGPMIGGIP